MAPASTVGSCSCTARTAGRSTRSATCPTRSRESPRSVGLVGAGDLVRTQADEDGLEARIGDTTRVQAALRSGAQLISTDYPTPADLTDYLVAIPAGEPSRCDPASAPADARRSTSRTLGFSRPDRLTLFMS